MHATFHPASMAPGQAWPEGDPEPIASADAARFEGAHRRIHELLATVAHELRNPLDSLGNAIELLSWADADAALTAEAASIARRQLQQMSQLITQLLDAGQMGSGQLALHRQRTQLQDVVASAVETTAPAFSRRCHTLTLQLPQAPIWIRADAVRCAQIFGNLLMNAAKYTPPHGRVTVAACEEQGVARVRVVDNGVGIAPEALDGVFDLFRQEQRNRGLSQGGLGIGLSVVKRLVQLHGGTVHAESGGAHQGSTFVVCLPLSSGDEGFGPGGPH